MSTMTLWTTRFTIWTQTCFSLTPFVTNLICYDLDHLPPIKYQINDANLQLVFYRLSTINLISRVLSIYLYTVSLVC